MAPPRMSIKFLGTSSMPNATRNYSSLLFKVDHHTIMVDCGESTQRQLQSRYIGGDERLSNIRTILVTHLHADHVLGIVPLLMSMMGGPSGLPTAAEASEPRVEIFGPRGLRALIRTTLTLCYSQLSGKYVVHEFIWPTADQIPTELPHALLDEPSRPIPHLPPHDNEALTGRDINIHQKSFSWPRFHSFRPSSQSPKVHVSAAPISHRCPTLGYVFEEEANTSPLESRVFDLLKENAAALSEQRGIRNPLSLISTLVGKRQSIELPDGNILHPPPLDVPGRKVTIMGDTKDGSGGFSLQQIKAGFGLPGLAVGSDVLVHESTNIALPAHLNRNGKNDVLKDVAERAASRGHAVPQVAGQFAALVKAKRLIINHFSTKYPSPPHQLLDTRGVNGYSSDQQANGTKNGHSGEPERKQQVIKQFELQAYQAWREAAQGSAGQSLEVYASFDGFHFDIPARPSIGRDATKLQDPSFGRPWEGLQEVQVANDHLSSHKHTAAPEESASSEWNPSPYLLASRSTSTSSPRHAMILLNSPIDLNQRGHFLRLWESASIRLCADGAANRLVDAFGYDAFAPSASAIKLPDAILGDLDSIRPDTQAFFGRHGVKVQVRPSQYATDLQKCVQEVEDQERSSPDLQEHTLIIFGGLAGRLDQSIHTLHVLWQLAPGVADLGGVEDPGDESERGGKLIKRRRTFAIGDGSVAWLLPPGKHTLRMDRGVMGKTCGILPLGTEGAKVSTKGLEWNLEGHTTTLGGFLSTSNHLADEQGRVEIEADHPIYWTVELQPDRSSKP